MRPEVKYRLIEKIIQMEDETILNQIQDLLEGPELSEAHIRLLDERLQAHKTNPEDVIDWEDVKAEIEKKS